MSAAKNMQEAIELREREEAELIEVFIRCEKCKGKGVVPDEWPTRANQAYEQQFISCQKCSGLGEICKEVMTCCLKSDHDCTCLD